MISNTLRPLPLGPHPHHGEERGERQGDQERRESIADQLNLGHKEDYQGSEHEFHDILHGKAEYLVPGNFIHEWLAIAEGQACTLNFAMQDLRLLLAASVVFTACSPVDRAGNKPLQKNAGTPPVVRRIDEAVAQAQAPGGVPLDGVQRRRIGMKIWQNESAGKVAGLTHWNEGEEFPSLGIGHFIWYPSGFNGRWTETWPEFVAFARNRGVRGIPSSALLPDCPWNDRGSFQRDFNGKVLTALRNWLAANIDVQTEFIMAKSRAALPRIMAAAPADQRTRIRNNYGKVATTPNGVYALIDYVNFKGDGTNPRERYGGQGWGLMWVLMDMRTVSAGQDAAREFAAAAKRRLDLRVRNSPPERGEKRWTAGWHNRCNTYAQPL